MGRRPDVTHLPAASAATNPADTTTSPDVLFEAVYTELRRLAGRYLRAERKDHTLQATALVHEAYLRLIGGQPIEWHNRAQLFSIASQVMRHILVDHARSHGAGKRGRGVIRVSLDEALDVATDQSVSLIALDDALVELATLDPEQSRVVELRYFGGLTIAEIADVLGVAEITVSRRWRIAKLWLHETLASRMRA